MLGSVDDRSSGRHDLPAFATHIAQLSLSLLCKQRRRGHEGKKAGSESFNIGLQGDQPYATYCSRSLPWRYQHVSESY